MMMVPGSPTKRAKQNPAFVKLLETVTRPSGNGMARGTTAYAANGTIEI
jgi:hypothetical protein